MLTEEHYTALWRNPAPNGFGQTHAMPSYQEYCIRENQIQDYLDIFRGRNTRNARHQNENDHPFQIYLDKKPDPLTIKYIMIGEAAPPLNPIIDPQRDEQNTFFYNPKHLGSTPYFSAPCNAFGINPTLSKLKKLLALAQKGVLLLDLFPFAVSYSTDLRNHLNNNNITTHFWMHSQDSIIYRINALEPLFDANVIIALIAPPKISFFIAHQINLNYEFWMHNGVTIRRGVNQFLINPVNEPMFNELIQVPQDVIHLQGRYSLLNQEDVPYNNVPYYTCCCYDGSKNPNQLFIRNAFRLNYRIELVNGNIIEVAREDFNETLTWYEAVELCNAMGDGWRLPTIEELQQIYNLRNDLNFANYGYWGYWSNIEIDNENAQYLCGPEGQNLNALKLERFYVRAVKDF